MIAERINFASWPIVGIADETRAGRRDRPKTHRFAQKTTAERKAFPSRREGTPPSVPGWPAADAQVSRRPPADLGRRWQTWTRTRSSGSRPGC
jgi:hypothetical protein